MQKKIVFLTGTRADYGKIKSLMKQIDEAREFELHIFVTGMHMLSKYGSTYREVEKDGFSNIYRFINQKPNTSDQMDIILSNTISGFSSYISETKPDLIVVHGDRVEALAACIVGALNNIKVMHIEGGEVSGTIDESIRHAITKFSHFHLVANEEAKKRILQLGEKEEHIYIFGSADIDIMYSDKLPSIRGVRERYDIPFDEYAIVMYHPVTTEVEFLKERIRTIVDSMIDSKKNYVVIFPNNDNGSDTIIQEYERLAHNKNIKIFSSMRFEYFLVLLKHAQFIMGNSSCGIREACVYGVPAIDIGSRQNGRYEKHSSEHIIHTDENKEWILSAIQKAPTLAIEEKSDFGQGNSDQLFMDILRNPRIWNGDIQKQFVDISF